MELPKHNSNKHESAERADRGSRPRRGRRVAHHRNRRKGLRPSRELAAYASPDEEPAYGAATGIARKRASWRFAGAPSTRRSNIITTTRSIFAENSVCPNEQALSSLNANGDVSVNQSSWDRCKKNTTQEQGRLIVTLELSFPFTTLCFGASLFIPTLAREPRRSRSRQPSVAAARRLHPPAFRRHLQLPVSGAALAAQDPADRARRRWTPSAGRRCCCPR